MLQFFFLIFLILNLISPDIKANEANTNTSSLTPITLQLMWKHQFEFAGFYAAKEKGFYQEKGLDVQFNEFNFGQNIVEEVVNGRAQYGINDSSLLIDRSKGSPVVLLSNIFQHSPMVLITKSSSGITSPAQMVGKKMMLATHELSNASITAMLNKESISLNQINIIEHTFSVDDLIFDKVDIMSSYATNEPGSSKLKNIPINIIHPINFGIDFYGNNIFTSEYEIKNNPQRVKDFVSASLKGWQYALEHPEEIIELISKEYNSQNKSKESLTFEANALKQFILPNFIPLGTVDKSRLQRIVETYQELGLLERNFKLDGFLNERHNKKNSQKNIFTTEEQDWIKAKKELVLGVDPNWRPFEFIDENKNYSGMAADFIQLIAKNSGLKLIIQDNKTWTDVINSAKTKNLDVLPAVMRSSQREKYLDFTTPHINYPMVIVTEKIAPFISELNDLKGETVVVVAGYVTEDIIRQNHPSIRLVTAKNINDALTLVSNGEATAFVDNLASITTSIHNGGYNNLRISGTTKYHFELGLAVPKNQTILLNILQKALDHISNEEKTAIKNKWISLEYTQKTDYTLLYKVIITAIIIFLIIIFWNRRLAEEVKSRKVAELKAQDSEKRFRMLFEDNKAIELIIDPKKRIIVEANHAAVDFYGYSHQELRGKDISQINMLTQQEIEQEMINAQEEKRNHFYFKHRLANGNIRDVEVHSGPVQWDNRTLLYSIIHDVTKEKELQTELQHKAIELEYQATHDALTGLVNRREFELRLHKTVLACTQETCCNGSILALDLDNFKVVNDTAGHAVGDDVLFKISQLMSSKVRTRDTFARLGGDEFGVLLDNCSIDDAEEVASSIIKAVKNFRYQWNDSTFHLGVSIGITTIEHNNGAVDETLNRADAACYEAKRLGRNRSQIFSEENTELSRRKGERWWTNEIVSAIDENRFKLYYQAILPISKFNQHEGNQFEVLIRLKDSEGNLVFPDSFIPAAERYHLMPTIDLWVIENTFTHISSNKNNHSALHKCSINLSGQSFATEGFYENVMNKFKTHNIPPHIICWEITETAAISDFNKAKDFINKMRAFGCSFSLDDFGSGLSSFNYLKHLDVDFIKIDGSFIQEILTNPKDQLIVESIQNISQGLGMQTIGEFVENEDIKQKLIDIGIDYAQGYGIHKPSPL